MSDELNPNLWRRVSELELPERAARALADANIHYIGELVQRTQAELLALDGFGKHALRDLRSILMDHGLDVGLGPIPEWSRPATDPAGTPAHAKQPIPARALEWEEVDGGIAIFVKPASAAELAAKMRAASGVGELEIGQPPLVFDLGSYGDDGFFFDDDDRLVIELLPATISRVIAALEARQRTISIGDDVRIEVRD